MSKFAPWPSYTEEEIEAVNRVLSSNRVNYWTGSEGRAFETEFARFADTRYAVALANGTVALELALKALDIAEGDEVIVTPRTFLASVSCIINAGATPVFADVDRDSQNITPDTVAPVITDRTRAILCVHLAGWPCDMEGMRDLARSREIAIIEDCAQAHGARLNGRSVGSFGDVGAWSFCQDKIITTGGEGGMVTMNDEALWSRLWSYKDHGKSYAAMHEADQSAGFNWVHERFGTNGRLTEMQAAIGRIQLKRMAEWHRRRVEIARAIWDTASKVPGLRVARIPDHVEHGAYKCYVFVRVRAIGAGWDRDRVMAEINERGVPCYAGSCPEVYLEKAFRGAPYQPRKRLLNAWELGETSLAFLCHPTLTDEQVAMTCDVLADVMRCAVRVQAPVLSAG